VITSREVKAVRAEIRALDLGPQGDLDIVKAVAILFVFTVKLDIFLRNSRRG